MDFNLQEFQSQLPEALRTFDRKKVDELCAGFIAFLFKSEEAIPIKACESVLEILRRKRMFRCMLRIADAYIQTGRGSYKIRRQYAQALVDTGFHTAALDVLNDLANDTNDKETEEIEVENAEAMGIIGRVYKQLYIITNNPQNPIAISFMKKALQSYAAGYAANPEKNLWHGINLVAMLRRAEADQVKTSGMLYPDKIAQQILNVINQNREQKQYWDFATAAEATLALGDMDAAIKWISLYTEAENTDSFEIASTLRQFTDIWKKEMNNDDGIKILSMLRSTLLKKHGSNIILDISDLQQQQLQFNKPNENLESVFGTTTFRAYQWYRKGFERCSAVGWIGKDTGQGFGTGFLMKGADLHPELKDQIVLMTNAHVVSDDPDRNAGSLLPSKAFLKLEVLDPVRTFPIDKVYWCSSRYDLDVSILLFNKNVGKELEKLTRDILFYEPATKFAPGSVSDSRIYVIGHPGGGGLKFSLQDNIFLNKHGDFLHYRTPTIGGSSGSPVFDDDWDLIGIHHAGSKEMRKLNSESGTYEANEGILMQSVLKELKKSKPF